MNSSACCVKLCCYQHIINIFDQNEHNMRCLKKRSLSGRCELVYGYSRSNVHTHYCRHCLHHSSCFNLPNLRHTALKAAWMVVASNLSTGPDRASPELLTSCKHHDLLSSALLWPTLCSAINCLSSQ